MRISLIFSAALLAATPAHAVLKSKAPPGASLVCTGSPAQDGCQIVPVPPGNSATLKDGSGNSWQFQNNTLFENGGAFGGLNALQINSGGLAFLGSACPINGAMMWQQNGNNVQWVSPTVSLANSFFNNTTTHNYNNYHDLIKSGTLTNNDQLEIKAMPGGLVAYYQFDSSDMDSNGNGAVITLDQGAVIGCGVSLSDSVFAFDTTGGAVTNITVKGAAGASPFPEIAYGFDLSSDGFRGIGIGHVTGFTVGPNLYIHDNNMGVISGNGSGTNGTITVKGPIVVEHNGCPLGVTAPCHNFYIGNDAAVFNVDGSGGLVESYCVAYPAGDFSTSGFSFKSRPPAGTWTNYVAAEVDPLHGHTDCFESAGVDLPCGGVYSLGGSTVGSGGVIQLGLNAQNTAAIRVGDDVGSGDCPGSVPWPSQAVVVNKNWIVLDAPGTPTVGFNPLNLSFTVQNSNIVCNTTQTCNATVLGTNVTNGGGNTFNTRAGFGLGACTSYPSNCPLPSNSL